MTKKIIALVGAVIILAFVAVFSTHIFETNKAGWMQVKQAAISGTLTCRLNAGTYGQWFGDIHEYKEATTFYFGVDDGAENTAMVPPLITTFADNARSDILGSVRVILPRNCASLTLLHREFKSMNGVMSRLVLPALRDVSFKTGPHMTSGESLAARRAEFSDLFRDQLLFGVVKTDRIQTKIKNLITGKEHRHVHRFRCTLYSKDGLRSFRGSGTKVLRSR